MVGVGKSSVLEEITSILEREGSGYAVVELDDLAVLPRTDPSRPLHDELVERLAAFWAGTRTERLVLARFLERPEQLRSIRQALPDVDLFVVRLVAPPALIEKRLRARDEGAELEEHLAFLRAGDPSGFEDAVVEIGNRSPREIATEVLAAAGW